MPKQTHVATQPGSVTGVDEPLVVAIFNSSPDIVDTLRHAIEQSGAVVVSVLTHEVREGRVDFEGFLNQHNPRVILYDIAPPYEANWRLFQHTAQMDAMKGRAVVISSVNAAQVAKVIGTDKRVFEVVGKAEDLDEIVRAVKEAARSRPTR